jgi:amino acid adenylation domain-containing protein/non-ribosomal peptide synthase protein (TIGR01720 family)
LANYIAWCSEAYAMRPGQVSLVHSSIAFDLTVTSLLAPLSVGATVHLVPEAPGIEALADAIRGAERVDVIKITPSHLQLLSQVLTAEERGRVGTLVVGGEDLTAEDVALWAPAESRLWNEYGPTETVVGACVYRLDGDTTRSGSIPIGRPIANTRLYVLDRALDPVPIGVPGELYIAGSGVARGYHRRPALTAELFVPDPFGDQPGARLYRTGDQARYRSDGNLEFLGRIDHQVKLRGYRIELGEIESVLEQHDAVDQAVAWVREDRPGDRRLVAYVVSADDRQFPESEFREYLTTRLPAYMVPSAVIRLPFLPLTPSGKVDHRALPAPEVVGQGTKAPSETPVQALIADTWMEVLGIGEVGLNDDFFDLGGHSLLSMRVVARLRKIFAIDLPLSALFDAPTLAGLAERVEVLRGADGRVAGTAIVLRPRDAEPLLAPSFAQQRMWFLDQIGAGAGYNMPSALRLTGEVDVAALRRSADAMVRRHEVLRTVFTTVDGQPRLSVLPTLELPVRVIDLGDVQGADQEVETRRLAAAQSQESFDLARGPLMRATLIRLGERDHVLLLTSHHIVGDGWSYAIFCRELIAFYDAFRAGSTPDLPELRVQYADFAAWQRQTLQGGLLEGQLEYWRRQLAELPVFGVPTDRPRPAVQTFHGAARSFEAAEPLVRALRELGRGAGVTLAMTLLAAYKVLLARYAGQDDVVVGSPIAGRTHPDVESLVGPFVNTLVLRTDLSGDPSFLEVLGRIRRVTLDAYDHQDVPFERIVDALSPVRDTSRNPLFQLGFTLQNTERVEIDLPDLSIRREALDITTARIDLELYLVESGDGLAGRMVYNTDLFDDGTIEGMSRHFLRLLESAVQRPSAPISELALLDDDEARKILVDWNDTRTPFADGACVHELIEARVSEAPDATAVVAQGGELTYGELNAAANRLAHGLRGMGIGPEAVVGLCTERSPDLIIGLLGILKAGAAYLPLDPNYPAARLEFMIRDSGATILLTQESLLPRLAGTAARTLCLDRDRALFDAGPDTNPGPEACADNLAYVIYTSGSTGTPKGTWLSHRGLCSLSEQQSWAFGVGPGSRVLQFSSLSFDASTFEIVMALPKGAALVLGTSETLLPGPDLVAFLRRHRVSIVTLPPTALAATPVEPLPDLEIITVAGEACPIELVRRWAPGRRFFNLYGPTEATIWSTMAQLGEDLQAVHIGRPIGNVQTYILDRTLRPVPVGVVGELYVAGVGLARGYLDRPDLTAERFVPNPFADQPGARMYRSGDLARHRKDGTIEFLGRADHQIKVRGFRIEPGEIETVIRQHAAVRDVVVLDKARSGLHRRLVAFVVNGSAGSEQSSAQESLVRQLRQRISQALPDYMMPSAFVLMDELPLTASGKVDRRALPEPDSQRPDLEADYVAPTSAVERTLVDIFARVLDLERVGVHDSFFELGGDSIMSIRVAALAREASLDLRATDLFRHPTVAELASAASAGDVVAAEQGLVSGPVELLPIQHWFLELELNAPHHFNQAFLFETQRQIDPELLSTALSRLIEHHDALRLRVRRSGSRWQSTIEAPGDGVPVETVDLSGSATTDHEGAIEAHASRMQASLNFSDGPILRAARFRLGDGRPDRVLLVIHHLAVDAVSWRILLEDLERLVGQLSRGEPATLPPKTTSIQEWASHLTQLSGTPDVARLAGRWAELPWTEVVTLPVDVARTGGTNTAASSDHVSVTLDEDLTEGVLKEVPAAFGATVNDVLLAGLVRAFAAWVGGGRLLVDLEGHGREDWTDRFDLGRTVGWFTTSHPVLLRLDLDADVASLLASVMRDVRSIPEPKASYGVARFSSRDRRLGSLPHAEVSFNYLGRLDHTIGASAMFRHVRQPIGPWSGPSNVRTHLIEINGVVLDGRLQTTWTYSHNRHRTESVNALGDGFIGALRKIVETSRESGATAYRPAAYGWTQSDLDDVLSDVDDARE